MVLHGLHLLNRSVERRWLLVHMLLVLEFRVVRGRLLVSLWLGLITHPLATVWLLLYFVHHLFLGDKLP